jgi:kumamolisin
VVGGTSAVAPLWAGLIALINQKLQGRIGFINPSLYAVNQSNCFRDITSGNNGAYTASPGWDAITGLGSPLGAQMLQTALGMGSATASQSNQETRTQTSVSR